MPDPQMSAWRKADRRLRKQGVAKKDRPARPCLNKDYPTKSQIGLDLLEQFKQVTVTMASARVHVHAHGTKCFVIALKYEGENEYRYIIASDLSWRAIIMSDSPVEKFKELAKAIEENVIVLNPSKKHMVNRNLGQF